MFISEILQAKGDTVYSIESLAPVRRAVELLTEHNVGSLVVIATHQTLSVPQPRGLITERDILRALGRCHGSINELAVEDVIAPQFSYLSPRDPVVHAMELMTQQRVRHLIVMDRGRLCGLISIGDVVKAMHDELTAENITLQRYIHGESAATLATFGP